MNVRHFLFSFEGRVSIPFLEIELLLNTKHLTSAFKCCHTKREPVNLDDSAITVENGECKECLGVVLAV